MVRRRGRIRTCNIRFQRPSCCQLHHPPICRFARPPTRWTPSAGPDVTGTARHCDHPQTLAVPRQGGCRGDPSHGSGARRAPHARRVAYLACLRRDLNPQPSAPEADALSTGPRRLVSSAVPTAVHVPDTHRAWNRTTIGIDHNPVAAPAPHTGRGRTTNHTAFISVLTASRVRNRFTALSSSGLVPPAGFEPATGRVETVCSDPIRYKGNLFPPERMSTTTRGVSAGMPDSFSPAAQRYGA